MQQNRLKSQNLIQHLARLNDCVFALAMAITFMGFNLPETVKSMANSEINHFLIEQLKTLGIYFTTFILVAFYWINHIQQFSYYKRTNEIHLSLQVLYLMCLFVIPFSNELVSSISSNAFAKVWFSVNICLLGFLSFISWVYATNKHRLVDENLDRQIILSMRAKTLIEPVCSLVSIPIALVSPDFSDLVWLLVPFVSLIVDKAFKVSSDIQMALELHDEYLEQDTDGLATDILNAVGLGDRLDVLCRHSFCSTGATGGDRPRLGKPS